MYKPEEWLIHLGSPLHDKKISGLVLVDNFKRSSLSPEQVIVLEKAKEYGAYAVFFEAGHRGLAPQAQAFIFVGMDQLALEEFGELHKRIWSWGGVPLVYLKTPGLVRLFRCAHKADFLSSDGEVVTNPFKTLSIASDIASDPWWDAERLRDGTLWNDSHVCNELLSSRSSHKRLIDSVKDLRDALAEKQIIQKSLQRKLLVLSILIAYLEEREAFPKGYFAKFLTKANKFSEVLVDSGALIHLLRDLEGRFNGHVFVLEDKEREALENNTDLSEYANFIHARKEKNGQLTLWELYSFKDLPVEVISHIYQLFVKNSQSSVYTPPSLVRLMLEEVMTPERIKRLHDKGECILDPSCGSGIFLVEAYKRLILHWRTENNWQRPTEDVLKNLLTKIHGIDLEKGAVELAAFSLCLALCDALKPEDLRASVKLFDPLMGVTLHDRCFFEAKEQQLLKTDIGLIVGNPPFESKLTTAGAKRSYGNYAKNYGKSPDKQVAYLFLHEAMEMLTEGGVLCMLQQYNFLYNVTTQEFRQRFFQQWNVREILDFISIRGLFAADTKVITIIAEAVKPKEKQSILHATFRRSGRVDAGQSFDIDYYDLHWVPCHVAIEESGIWRANLLGGERVLAFTNRLKKLRTLGDFVGQAGWDMGEGFIAGKKGANKTADFITGKKLIEPCHLHRGSNIEDLQRVKDKKFTSTYTKKRYSSPMVLIHQQEDLQSRAFMNGYYTYKDKIVGITAPKGEANEIDKIANWLDASQKVLQAFVTASGITTFTQKSTWVGLNDVKSLPYPEDGNLDISTNEKIIVSDVVDYYRDFIRLGEKSRAMEKVTSSEMSEFNSTFTRQITGVYKSKKLHALDCQSWSGITCQPFVFGKGRINWSDCEGLKDKIDSLLNERHSSSLHITRIARIYDEEFIFLLKPDRLRYWLRSIALRDADETLADMRSQGF